MSGSVKSVLEKATKGLLFMSESDEPFDVLEWPAEGELTSEEILRLSGNAPGTPVTQQPIAQFFDDAVAQQDDDKDALGNLRAAIEGSLANPKVFRVGETEIAIYIVGKEGNRWMGVKTKAVET
jgi:hypothetical protein